jgi:CRISPR-associated endoribonuclease Cas6
MRLLVELSARAAYAYQNDWHRKLAGRIWQALRDTPYDDRHNNAEPPGFVFSNPFPPEDAAAGDSRHLLVASPDEELLAYVADDLQRDRELNVGEMPLYVDRLAPLSTDVGEPGSEGTLETGTGVLVRIPPERCSDYGVDHPQGEDGDTAVYWRPEHTMEPFRTQIENNLDRKHGLYAPDHLPGPSDQSGNLFDGYNLLKTFAVPVDVTDRKRLTYVLSKWRFEYTVRDDHHRRHLNLALDCGIGERNSLGLGLLNLPKPDEDETEPATSRATNEESTEAQRVE